MLPSVAAFFRSNLGLDDDPASYGAPEPPQQSAPPAPYDPRDQDQGLWEAPATSSYNDPAAGGTQSAPIPASVSPESPNPHTYNVGDSRQYDEGPRETGPAPWTPLSATAQPVTPPEPFSPYGAPRSAVADINPSAAPTGPEYPGMREDAQRRGLADHQPVRAFAGEPDYVAPGRRPITMQDIPDTANAVAQAGVRAAQDEWQGIKNPTALSIVRRVVGPVPGVGTQEVGNVLMAVIDKFGDTVGRRVAQAMGMPHQEYEIIKERVIAGVQIPSITITNEDVAGLIGSAVLDPTNYLGAGEARPIARAAGETVRPMVREAAEGVAGRVRGVVDDAVEGARSVAGRALNAGADAPVPSSLGSGFVPDQVAAIGRGGAPMEPWNRSGNDLYREGIQESAVTRERAHRPIRPGTYYHVVPEGYRPGDPLLSADELAARGYPDVPNKWAAGNGGDATIWPDRDKVALAESYAEAYAFNQDYLKGRGRILEVVVPPDADALGVRIARNEEGVLSANRMIPAEWVRPAPEHSGAPYRNAPTQTASTGQAPAPLAATERLQSLQATLDRMRPNDPMRAVYERAIADVQQEIHQSGRTAIELPAGRRALSNAGDAAARNVPAGESMLGSGLVPESGPNPSQFGPNPNAAEPWRMAPDEWRAEMARVSPDGQMPDPSVNREAYQRWYQLNANKPVSETPTVQTGPFESDPRLRPAIESSYLRPDDFRFVSGITVTPRTALEAESTMRARAGLQSSGPPRAKFERDGRMTFQQEILSDDRVGRTLTHEVGHSIENNLPESLMDRWKAEIHPDTRDPFEYGRFLENGGERPPTQYASENAMEDFAESFTEWRQAQAEGRAPNLGPKRLAFMQDVDSWLSGGARGVPEYVQPRMLGSGAAPTSVRPGLIPTMSDARNAAQGAFMASAYDSMSDEELTPQERMGRMAGTALMTTAAGRAGRGRGTRAPGQRLGSGMVPDRPQSRLTVEVLQERVGKVKALLDDARARGDTTLARDAEEVLTDLRTQMFDAITERRRLEPRITSEVGRRMETLPPTESGLNAAESAVADGRGARAASELSGPVGVPTSMAGRQNAVLPFDPVSAAAGAGAGTEVDEDGNPVGVDPLRAAAGMAFAGMAGTPQGRRLVLRSARAAKNTAPPNLLELMQNFRFSWGMLGNLGTGVFNASGAPVEIALGLSSEAVRNTIMHGRPLAVGFQAAELLSGVKQGVRDMLGTIIGQVPDAVRNSPDFRPPINERMQGTAGKALGHAIEAPGRITSQAPDALFRPGFERWGRAVEAGNIMSENGISRLNPAAQWREMVRLRDNPTPEEAARLDKAAKQWADEVGYKGDAGYFEQAIGSLVRPNNRMATSNDPVAAQVHEALGSFVMPFFGAVWKLHKQGLSRVPVVNFLTNRSLATDQKISRAVVGSAVGLYIADRAAQGLVTGPGPSDPDEAALVNKDMPPFHSYVPGLGWVPNEAFGSAGPYLNSIGGYYDSRRYATDKEKADADKMGERYAKDFLRGFARFPVAQAVQNFVTMVESPTKGATDFLANAGSSFVPAPFKSYATSQDTVNRTTDREAGFADQLGQKLQNRTGIMRQQLPAAQDRLGRDVENPRQGWAAFLPNVKQPQNDPIIQLLRENGVEPGFPKKELTPKVEGVRSIPPIDMTPKEQRAWNTARGQKLIEYLQPKVSDPAFQALPPDVKKANIDKYLTAAGQYADGVLQSQIGGPEITRRINVRRKAS